MNQNDLPASFDEALKVIAIQREELEQQAKLLNELRVKLAAQDKAVSHSGAGLLQRFRQSLLRRPTGSETVKSSGLFDEEYYRSQLLGRPDLKRAEKNLLNHYLSVGAFEGLDPCERFDSDWYLEVNSDVRTAGLNPLVHYLQYGQHEGRLPYHGAQQSIFGGTPRHTSDFNARLWGGFSHVAMPELEALADQGQNSRAAWCLAAWCYAHGDLPSALQRVQQSIENEPRGATKKALVGLAKCYTLLEDYSGLEALLTEPESARGLGNIYPYVRANLLNGQGRPLDCCVALNDIFSRVGLVGVAMKDASLPLSLSNLQGIAAPESIHGNAPDAPLISVVVPAYNAGGTLHIALDGLLGQSWTNLEIIVVDDGSSDDTAQVAQSYEKKDPRVRYLPNSRNMGAYPTRNNGMKAARGDFVTVHDSDDWSHPQKLERQMQPLLNDDSKVATISSWVRVAADMRFVGPWLLSDTYVEKNHSSVVLRRAILEQIGYWDEVNVAGDTEFLWRLEHHFEHHRIVHILPFTPLSFALADDASLTRTKATHVKTIHYGLRRIYREAASWWHRKTDGRPVLENDKERPFPIPLGIVRGSEAEFDAVLVGDMAAEGEDLERLLKEAADVLSKYKSVCLFHWPGYDYRHGAPIADEVFELCLRHRLSFAHTGLTVSADKVVILGGASTDYMPTQGVRIENLDAVVNTQGDLCGPQAELMEYFAKGGVQAGED
ncbi:glycosyltransferase family A protein [Marinimicrobium sp. ABcell2]|uniref:glycosyltransferase family 2 protein n=1 Tax=Marinimicrobium sp. ABcell2 TaxID=3069751 RepID=UPI0027B4C3C0|nr:glycosyltransferase family A protein [Marinimicrobium sp. ABcell2]MDQ2078331.1 glycosyltransferase family A protein [Marinimicrobium sp. ABcell2]